MNQNEKDFKKYETPQMNVVNIRAQVDLLLVCSGEEENGITCSDDEY